MKYKISILSKIFVIALKIVYKFSGHFGAEESDKPRQADPSKLRNFFVAAPSGTCFKSARLATRSLAMLSNQNNAT